MMIQRIRSVAFLIGVGMCSVLWSGCASQPVATSNNGNSAPRAETAKPPSDRGDRVVTGGDLDFMNQAAMGSLAEVELGRLALNQAASADVKGFAQQMIDDHSKAAGQLKQLAQGKNVMLPLEISPSHKQTMEKLTKLKGAECDREYVKAMVEDHVKDVTAFGAVAQNATDADVKAFAAKTLPTLQEHLQMIRGIAAKLDVR